MPHSTAAPHGHARRYAGRSLAALLVAAGTALAASLAGCTARQPRGAAAKPQTAVSQGVGGPSEEEVGRNWPRFRGPGGLGVSAYANVPTAWNGQTGKGILWKTPVPLPGQNSPVVWGKRVFLSGATAGEREVYCFDADSGKLLWRSPLAGIPGSPSKPPDVSEDAGFAAPTVATDGRHVCAMFANGNLVCLDLDGRRVWATNFDVSRNQYGYASSLVIYGNLLLVLLDQGYPEDGLSRLVAVDVASGATVWEAKRPVPSSWATPIVVDAGARQEVVTCGNPWVIAYDPATGKELWRAECLGGDVAPSPAFAGGLVFAANANAFLVALRPGGDGNVTATHVAWTATDNLPDTCSPLATGDLVFLLTTQGVLTCYDAQTGQIVWDKDLQKTFRSSPGLAGDRVYVTSADGVTFIVKADRAYRELGRAALGEPTDTSLAFADGRIYIRGKKHLFCLAAPGK